MTTTPDAPPATKRRRWFRFRLRTLFGLVTASAILMGWVAKERNQSHHERQIAKQLEKQGAHLTFGGPYDSVELLQKQQPPGWRRTLARRVLGERILRTHIMHSKFSDLAPLAGLKNLVWLRLESIQVSDLTPLAGLKNLHQLHVYSTPVSDLTPLAGLKNLEGLTLFSKQVSDLTPLAGLKNLQRLTLDSTQVSDLTPLAGLKNLKLLNLDSTPVSDEQIESLQQALPDCRIY